MDYPTLANTRPSGGELAVVDEAHTVSQHTDVDLYGVWLDEVPLDGGTMVVVDTAGPTTLTEVSTAPAAGEYRVHYSGSWIGFIEHAAADAGMSVEVDYDGTGSAPEVGVLNKLIKAVGFIGAQVLLTAAQSIPTSTATAIEWDSELIDTDGFVDLATNPTRFTVPAGHAGKYRLLGQMRYASNSTGFRRMEVLVNGSTPSPRPVSQQDASASSQTYLQLGAPFDLSEGDYVEVVAEQNSGGALDVDSAGNFTTAILEYLGA